MLPGRPRSNSALLFEDRAESFQRILRVGDEVERQGRTDYIGENVECKEQDQKHQQADNDKVAYRNHALTCSSSP